ncbi:uncharacterized protein LAJ45_07386 [Morchella importuna]|uniref:uncharacterized protein n=1 Tax=Morchella importuna TaxID=1174673 RepID=UPI001E8D5D5B|nr:uncharacterized protein LAJ45_07386 [Morchella importuna]KAH8148675.1 hypothetical protein LAJ45_07386 [Morchella importuna]
MPVVENWKRALTETQLYYNTDNDSKLQMENLATLYLVDNRGNTKGRGMICPLEHIDTYEKLASTLTLLFPEDAARAGDLKFQVMTNDRLLLNQGI